MICRRVTSFQVNRVEHQKLNQTTPYGTVWLSFWCSTQPAADTGTDMYHQLLHRHPVLLDECLVISTNECLYLLKSEHQKINQTTPNGAVWLSFWFSTRPSADTVTY